MDFLISLFFFPEDGSQMIMRNVVEFQRTIRRCDPEESTYRNHLCWNLKSYNYTDYFVRMKSVIYFSVHRIQTVSNWNEKYTKIFSSPRSD
jgi:hypothetical protein